MEIKNCYSFSTKIKLSYWFLRSKLICSKSRIIRFPFDLRGKKFVDFGIGLTTGIGCRIEAFSEDGGKTIFFGKNVQLNDYVHISAMKRVDIGDNVLMASKIYISDNSHGFYKGNEFDSSPEVEPLKRFYNIKPVKIEANVWIGEGVVVLPGVTIGIGSIIGANSVVIDDIPPFTIAVGQPAKPIKKYDTEIGRWLKL